MRVKLLGRESIPEVIKAMTLEEKVNFVTAKTSVFTDEVKDLGIPRMCLADGVTGINFIEEILDMFQQLTSSNDDKEGNAAAMQYIGSIMENPEKAAKEAPEGSEQQKVAQMLCELKPNGEEPVAFPSGMILGAAWSPEAVYNCGVALGHELDAYQVDVVLGPNVDIIRDPLCGRAYECYSEDPYLVSKTAVSLVKGIQSVGIAACAKHFVANNQETGRHGLYTYVSERALREIYYKGFEAAIKEGKLMSVMSAYNRLNEVYCSHNKELLTDLLRGEWGFEGCVVSDWGAVVDKPAALASGNDLILPGPNDMTEVYKAIENGTLTEEALDICISRILGVLVDTNCFKGRDISSYDPQESLSASYQAVVEGSVLLKNEEALPLSTKEKTVFWGKRSKKLIECGAGSTQVQTSRSTNIFDSSINLAGEDNVLFEEFSKEAKTLVYTVSLGGHEGSDLEDMNIEEIDKESITHVLIQAKEKDMKTVVVLNTAAPVDMRDWISYADAILFISLPGTEGGHATADMLYGKETPAGKLPVTFPMKYLDTPASITFPAENGHVYYGEDIYVGYRYYDKKEIEPMFPFGHGLSYTTFEVKMPKHGLVFDMRESNSITIPIQVRNTGDRKGSEVVQLYVSQKRSTLKKPVKELKGYQKLHLLPGEEKIARITLTRDSFTSYDEKLKEWTAECGEYHLLIGTSSRNIVGEIELELKGENPYRYGAQTPLNQILNDEKAKAILLEILPNFLTALDKLPFGNITTPLGQVLGMTVISFIPDASEAAKITNKIYERLGDLY